MYQPQVSKTNAVEPEKCNSAATVCVICQGNQYFLRVISAWVFVFLFLWGPVCILNHHSQYVFALRGYFGQYSLLQKTVWRLGFGFKDKVRIKFSLGYAFCQCDS